VFLIFLVGYTVRAMPFWGDVAKTFDEQYARCAEGLGLASRAAWIAIGWIAFETIVGWWMALRSPAARKPPSPPVAAKTPPGEPPLAPPR
jgi:hypothetical protein